MARFDCDFAVCQRSRGGHAGKLCAYDTCGEFMTEKGEHFDFRRKQAEHQGGEVILPKGAPSWAGDPQELWNKAEAAEHRADAQTARMIMLSIPREIPAHQRMDFIRHMCQPWVQEGMACQFNIHSVTAADGQEQPHAHILLSMRRLTPQGFSDRKETKWNALFREGRGRAERIRIADRMNAWMRSHDIQAQVSATKSKSGMPAEQKVSRAAWEAYKRDPQSEGAAQVRAILEARYVKQEIAKAASEYVTATQEIRSVQAEADRQFRPASDHWADQRGGLDRLNPAQQAAAQAAYDKWSHGTPNPGFPLDRYVSYVQGRREVQGYQPPLSAGSEPGATGLRNNQPDGFRDSPSGRGGGSGSSAGGGDDLEWPERPTGTDPIAWKRYFEKLAAIDKRKAQRIAAIQRQLLAMQRQIAAQYPAPWDTLNPFIFTRRWAAADRRTNGVSWTPASAADRAIKRITNSHTWTAQTSGFNGLDDHQRQAAGRAFQAWTEARRKAGEPTEWDIKEYVSYVQDKHGEERAARIAAISALRAAETAAGRNPAALSAARLAIRAAAQGDARTIADAKAGDLNAALAAAQAWQTKRERRQAEEERKKLAALAAAEAAQEAEEQQQGRQLRPTLAYRMR